MKIETETDEEKSSEDQDGDEVCLMEKNTTIGETSTDGD